MEKVIEKRRHRTGEKADGRTDHDAKQSMSISTAFEQKERRNRRFAR